jgi:hypothetical protein
MKFLKPLLAVGVLSLFFFSSTTMSSCVKETIIRDTIIIKDSVCCSDLKTGLIAWYKFTGGSLKDSSGQNNHITINSNAVATTDRFGRANNAYLFNGRSNFMSVPNSASLNPDKAITIMAIIKIKGYYGGLCHANNILSKGWNDYVNGYYDLRFIDSASDCYAPVDSAKERFTSQFGNYDLQRVGTASSNPYLQKERWYNVVYTYGSRESKLYIDGVLVSTLSHQFEPNFTPNNLPLTIGYHGDPLYPYWFNGVMDEIRIYKRALCHEEVKCLNALKD